MIETEKIYNENCLDLMQRMPDGFVDCVVTDPPYRIQAGGATSQSLAGIFSVLSDGTDCSNRWLKKDGSRPAEVKNGRMFQHNDIEFSQWLPEVYRVLKPKTHCYVMTNSRNLKQLQIDAEQAGFVFQNLLVWLKNNATPNKFYMQNGEFILMLSKRPARWINNLGEQTVFSIPNIIGSKVHPSEKPVELMKRLIAESSDEGDLVFDPFMGSGATAQAAHTLNRRWLGSEIDAEYIEIANKRLTPYLKQKSLF